MKIKNTFKTRKEAIEYLQVRGWNWIPGDYLIHPHITGKREVWKIGNKWEIQRF